MTYTVAVAPGDGIGQEVVPAALSVLNALGDSHGFAVETVEYDMGAHRYDETGELLSDERLSELRSHDAVLLGAVGVPAATDTPVIARDHHRIRKAFDLWCNLRPAYLFDGSLSPLSGYEAGDVDVLWFRENSEGEYVDVGGALDRGGSTELAIQCSAHTRTGIERIVRSACEAAADRSGRLTYLTKANVLSDAGQFWHNVVDDVVDEHPDVTAEHRYVDAANLAVVTQPEEFDVVVAPNLFSDILTDATAGVVGGLGVAPSANLNPGRDVPGLFEPVHGTAPDIAGQGVANPLATVLSVALLLDDVGEPGAADALRDAVAAQLAGDGPRTPDLGGTASTTEVVDDLRRRL